jgi:sugar lactone lactonase YvrE
VARVTRAFDGDTVPLSLPTAVSLGLDGTASVADGVNNRIVAFPVEGQPWVIDQVGEHRLSRPIGLEVTADGRLWIADTGNGRVLVRDTRGGLSEVITVPDELGGARVDITGVVVADDGRVWLVDNQLHRLLLRTADGKWHTATRRGRPRHRR